MADELLPMNEDDCPYCAGVEEMEALLGDGSRDYVPCPHPCHRLTTGASEATAISASDALSYARGIIEQLLAVLPDQPWPAISKAKVFLSTSLAGGAATPELLHKVSRVIHEHLSRRDIMQYLDNEEDCEGLARTILAALSVPPPPSATDAGVLRGALRTALRAADNLNNMLEAHQEITGEQLDDEDRTCVEAWLNDLSVASAALSPAIDSADGGGEVGRLSDILDTERYKVAAALQGIKRAIDGRRWLSEPGRGSYTYDDERYQAEFGQAIDEIDAALQPLRIIAGDWSDCPRDPLRVAANRKAALATPSQTEEERR